MVYESNILTIDNTNIVYYGCCMVQSDTKKEISV